MELRQALLILTTLIKNGDVSNLEGVKKFLYELLSQSIDCFYYYEYMGDDEWEFCCSLEWELVDYNKMGYPVGYGIDLIANSLINCGYDIKELQTITNDGILDLFILKYKDIPLNMDSINNLSGPVPFVEILRDVILEMLKDTSLKTLNFIVRLFYENILDELTYHNPFQLEGKYKSMCYDIDKERSATTDLSANSINKYLLAFVAGMSIDDMSELIHIMETI